MKFKELKNKTPQELEILLKESRNKILDLEIQATTGQLKHVREIRKNKTMVAQILTLINNQSNKQK